MYKTYKIKKDSHNLVFEMGGEIIMFVKPLQIKNIPHLSKNLKVIDQVFKRIK